MNVSLADRIAISVDGLESPSGAWIKRMLEPLRGGAPVGARISFGGEIRPSGRALSPLPVWPAGTGFHVADHLERAAFLPLADLTGSPIVADANIDPWFFSLWVYLPVARALLWRNRTSLLHASGAAIDGKRVAITAWQGTGKSLVMLSLMRDGAELLADDWLALTDDGHVGPLSAQLNLTDDHRAHVPSWPGSRGLTPSLARATQWASKRAARFHKASVGFARASDLMRRASKRKVALTDVFPGARVATPGPLDALVVLVRPGTRAPEASQIAEMLAASAAVEWRHCADLEAAFRCAFPGVLRAPLFPTQEEDAAHFSRALSEVPIIAIPFESDTDVVPTVRAIRATVATRRAS